MSNEYLYDLGDVIIITQSDHYEYRSKSSVHNILTHVLREKQSKEGWG